MNNLTQTLGFDCSSALQSLQTLNESMGRYAQTIQATGSALNSFNSQGQATTRNLQAMAAAASKLSAAMASIKNVKAPTIPTAPKASGIVDQFGKPLANAGDVAAKAAQVKTAFDLVGSASKTNATIVGLSWETMGRIVGTQLIVRALSQLRNAFGDAGRSAIDFQRRVAEVATIADSSFGDEAAIATRIKALSTSFTIPLPVAAESVYQTLSNGIDTAAKADEFLTASAKFSKAAVTDQANAVNLLSAALNGYGKDTSETGAIAGKFFEMIRVGRLRADDIANSFGRVQSVAREAGISLEETMSAVATLTQSGVKPAEAMTGLRSTISAFLKPADAMKSKLKELGYESGPAALAANGLGRSLKLINDSVSGDAGKLAAIFPNIRALSSILQLGNTQAERFKANTGTITNAGAALNDAKAAQVMGTAGSQLTRELNKLHVAWTGFGEDLVTGTNSVLQWTHGVDLSIASAKVLAPAITATATGIGLYAAAAGTASIATRAWASSLGALPTALAAVGVAMSVGKLIGGTADYLSTRNLTALENANKARNDAFATAESERLQLAQNTDKARIDSLLATSQQAAASYQADVAKAKEADEAIVADVTSAAGRIVSAREKLVAALGKAIDESKSISDASKNRVTDLSAKRQQAAFDNQTRHANDQQKAQALISYSQKLAREASSQLSKASRSGDQRGIGQAVNTFGRSQSAASEAAAIAARVNDRRLEASAVGQVNSALDKQLSAERQLQSVQAARRTQLVKEKTDQQAIVNQVKQAAKTLAANSSSFDSAGNPLSADKLAEQAKKREAAIKTIVGAGSKSKDLSLANSLGLASLAADIGKAPVALAFDSRKGIANVQQQIDSAFSRYKAKLGFDVSGLEKATGKKFANPDQVTAGLRGAQSEAEGLRSTNSARAKALSEMGGIYAELLKIDQESEQGLRGIIKFWRNFAPPDDITQKLQTFKKDFANVGSSTKISDSDIVRLIRELKELSDIANPTGTAMGKRPALALDVAAYDKGIAKLQHLQQLQRQAQPGNPQRLNQLDTATGKASQNTQATARGFQALQQAAQQAGAATNRLAQSMAQTAESAQAAATASARIGGGAGSPSISGGARMAEEVERAHGGAINFLASGGKPRGTDKVPAMLSAGEWVMTARSARAFAPQLAAMNAGMNPNFRANGGSITNHVGDISVHVAGGQTGTQTGRAIAHTLKRELRRGSVTL